MLTGRSVKKRVSARPMAPANGRPITAGTKVVAVIGDPVQHSLSPRIHNAAFAELGLDWAYVAFGVQAGGGGAALEAMRTLKIAGLNVTMPLKAEIAAAIETKTAVVHKLDACNCVYWSGSTLVGDNTDGDGFVASLEAEHGVSPEGMCVAVLGAGGAARAIIDALSRHGAERIFVMNRTPEAARVAAGLSSAAEVASADMVSMADLVINATSVGMGVDRSLPLDPAHLRSTQIVADIVYQPHRTGLLEAAENVGAKTLGGLGMLVHQAAASFERFTGVAAPLDAMTRAASLALAHHERRVC